MGIFGRTKDAGAETLHWHGILWRSEQWQLCHHRVQVDLVQVDDNFIREYEWISKESTWAMDFKMMVGAGSWRRWSGVDEKPEKPGAWMDSAGQGQTLGTISSAVEQNDASVWVKEEDMKRFWQWEGRQKNMQRLLAGLERHPWRDIDRRTVKLGARAGRQRR